MSVLVPSIRVSLHLYVTRGIGLLICTTLFSCGRSDEPRAPAPTSGRAEAKANREPPSPLEPPPGTAEPATAAPPRLEGPSDTTPLEVPSFQPAEHVVPVGATGPRPVVVVLHGNFDRPEWECETWAEIVRGRAFILCTRGIPRRGAPREWDRWEYGGRARTLREVQVARQALAERYPGFVDDGPDVWVGFSLGAILLAPTALEDPARYPRIYLVEGGVERWDRDKARRFAIRGGKKIAMACGRPMCRRQAEALAALLEAQGAAGRVAYAQVGHNYGDELMEPMRQVFDWLVEDDPRFRAGESTASPD